MEERERAAEKSCASARSARKVSRSVDAEAADAQPSSMGRRIRRAAMRIASTKARVGEEDRVAVLLDSHWDHEGRMLRGGKRAGGNV